MGLETATHALPLTFHRSNAFRVLFSILFLSIRSALFCRVAVASKVGQGRIVSPTCGPDLWSQYDREKRHRTGGEVGLIQLPPPAVEIKPEIYPVGFSPPGPAVVSIKFCLLA